MKAPGTLEPLVTGLENKGLSPLPTIRRNPGGKITAKRRLHRGCGQGISWIPARLAEVGLRAGRWLARKLDIPSEVVLLLKPAWSQPDIMVYHGVAGEANCPKPTRDCARWGAEGMDYNAA